MERSSGGCLLLDNFPQSVLLKLNCEDLLPKVPHSNGSQQFKENMRSKSIDGGSDTSNHVRGFDFIDLYKSTAETNAILAKTRKSEQMVPKLNPSIPNSYPESSKRERSPIKNRKKQKKQAVELSQISIDGRNLDTRGSTTPVNEEAVNAANRKINRSESLTVKSIMKNTSTDYEIMDESSTSSTLNRRKKRNKSVSFMLEDHEEIVIKKTKSEDSMKLSKKEAKKAERKKEDKFRKLTKTKNSLSEKENKINDVNMENSESRESVVKTMEKKLKLKEIKQKSATTLTAEEPIDVHSNSDGKRNKKLKKEKKPQDSTMFTGDGTNDEDNVIENIEKKRKKKKRKAKASQATDTPDLEGEPKIKSSKKDFKPEIIEDLENLSIGDNAHTLTNLLDEMTVVDKKKKNKQKNKKSKAQNLTNISSNDTEDLEKIEEGKEKVIWKKRKWNKDRKGVLNNEKLIETSVIIENIPLEIIFSYKKTLAEHFAKCGLIQGIGVAEVYPTEESRPVFTTTIYFDSEEGATKALEEDNMLLKQSRIRVKRPLPPTQTTVVVRSYADITEQSLSSVFSGAGKIRSIRQLMKGNNSMGTAFVEFDGPEAVERALAMTEDARIGGKKMYAARFEHRAPAKRSGGPAANRPETEDGDSTEC